MTRIDFYVLEAASARQHDVFICRLAEKCWREGHRVHIRCDAEAATDAMDDLLWTYKDTSFLPHTRQDAAEVETTPITLGFGQQEPPTHDILINLGTEVPEFFSRFERVMETTGHDDAGRQSARQRYRFYQERGYQLQTHKLDGFDGQ